MRSFRLLRVIGPPRRLLCYRGRNGTESYRAVIGDTGLDPRFADRLETLAAPFISGWRSSRNTSGEELGGLDEEKTETKFLGKRFTDYVQRPRNGTRYDDSNEYRYEREARFTNLEGSYRNRNIESKIAELYGNTSTGIVFCISNNRGISTCVIFSEREISCIAKGTIE